MQSREPEMDFDDSYLNSLRELKAIGVIGGVALGWTIIFSGMSGYTTQGAAPSVTMGMPTWVFWGIVAPWIMTGILTIGFATFVLREDDHDLTSSSDNVSGEDSAP